MLGDQRLDALGAAASGFAADACVDHPVPGVMVLEPLFEKTDPALVQIEAEGRAQAVAHNQDRSILTVGAGGGRREGKKEQDYQQRARRRRLRASERRRVAAARGGKAMRCDQAQRPVRKSRP